MTDRPKHQHGCLFCRRVDGGFRSREHIFSEALGNHEYVLPPGVVCDRCNNGPLSRADAALINFPPITLLRAERGLPTKSGQPIVSKWGNAHIMYSAPGELNVLNTGKRALRGMPTGGGPVPPDGAKMELNTGGPVTTARVRKVVQSIWKSALEFVYWDHGAEVAFNEALDPARTAVLDAAPPGWATLTKTTTPHQNVQLQYVPTIVDGEQALPIRMDVFGVEFHTDPLRRDHSKLELTPPFSANVWKF
ncbi:MAG: hypothetical protein JHC95_06000 [Solirubrobacteraceae bacterium]|nr:hypothetical protein [Solirubrobacteraceae bacterium]